MIFLCGEQQYDTTHMITVEIATPFKRVFYITSNYDRVFAQLFDHQTGIRIERLSGLNKSIEAQLVRARDLEVKHARALYKSGKTTAREGSKVIAEARRRVG